MNGRARAVAIFVAGLASVACLLGAAGVPAAQAAAKSFKLGFADDRFADRLLFGDSPTTRSTWARRMDSSAASLVRLNVYWGTIVGGAPADATDPGDPAYDWKELDRAISAATARGMEPVLTVLSAPYYAERPNRPAEVRPGTWRPRPGEVGKFAEALATRYSGSYVSSGGVTLPRVTYYEAWNEPNLASYISPQRVQGNNTSPTIYRKLLNAFYDAVKGVHASNRVIVGGTAPYGESTGTRRIPPLEFWRDVLCLRNRNQLRFARQKCPAKANRARFDIFAHNSINSPGDPPQRPASHPDNATAADMHKLVRVIRAAERHGSVLPAGKRRPVWSTELWFESSPPEKRRFALSLPKQADAVAMVQYLLWKQGVSAGIFLQIRDSRYTPDTPAVVGLQSGIYRFGGKPKPSRKSARLPFVADRLDRKRIRLWTRSDGRGKVDFQRRRSTGGWQRVARAGGPGSVAKAVVKLRGRQVLRAKLAGITSRPWTVRR